jgi:hypothetical protein
MHQDSPVMLPYISIVLEIPVAIARVRQGADL